MGSEATWLVPAFAGSRVLTKDVGNISSSIR